MTLPGDPSPTSAPDPAGGRAAYDADAKKVLRRRLRTARAARSATDREQVASGLAVRVGTVPEVTALVAAGGGVVAAYASLGDEPGTGALRALLALSGVRVLLPVIRDDGRLDWGWDSDDLVPRAHRLAIPEPAADPALGTGAAGLAASGCSVVLVPALAVGHDGCRLGQGGGFYDRLLADVPEHLDGGPLLVAVVHDDEVLDSVPHEPHDRPVDAVLTPTTYRRFSG
ncbi:5-formyltetrahydrofolate cyclo-ligase [Longivirga aurantiaca]|uniref:5-formyltetrahydrofolate cyclo-ligase n=1 Tax=Longivirga aurantiaca TaxID=1837743 RepID=A0ABW1SWT1_9ACTN